MYRAALDTSSGGQDDVSPEQALLLVRHETHNVVIEQYRVLNEMLVPEMEKSDGDEFVFLSFVIHTHVCKLFLGMDVTGYYQFRVTRDSGLFVEEKIDDLMQAIMREL